MIIELPNYIDAETIAEIRNSVKPFLPKVKKHQFNRDGFTVNITQNKELTDLDNKINDIFSKLQNNILAHRYKPIIKSVGSTDFEYHLYEAGDICRCHSDGEICLPPEKNYSLIRYASVVVHLSTINEGGEFVFPNQNTKIKTEAGKVVIFPPYGFYEHYTTPSNENREILVTWFVYNGVNAIRT
jgi:predicted 2-oxoglutarate/Fe(II)-dependent dioxygenase YbiX